YIFESYEVPFLPSGVSRTELANPGTIYLIWDVSRGTECDFLIEVVHILCCYELDIHVLLVRIIVRFEVLRSTSQFGVVTAQFMPGYALLVPTTNC
ncbi:hypothetical protein WG66_005264, partial [Moniliophthora roreri]